MEGLTNARIFCSNTAAATRLVRTREAATTSALRNDHRAFFGLPRGECRRSLYSEETRPRGFSNFQGTCPVFIFCSGFVGRKARNVFVRGKGTLYKNVKSAFVYLTRSLTLSASFTLALSFSLNLCLLLSSTNPPPLLSQSLSLSSFLLLAARIIRTHISYSISISCRNKTLVSLTRPGEELLNV